MNKKSTHLSRLKTSAIFLLTALLLGSYAYAAAPNSATYVISSSTGASLSTGGTNILPNAGDQGVSVPVPFDLTIYDQTFTAGTNVFIPTKGNMQFTTSSINFSPTCIPTSTFTGINI